MLNINENTDNFYITDIPTNENNVWNCGAIIRCNNGYGNYILSQSIELFTIPNDDNFQDWYQIKDFQDITENIRYIRPVKSTLKNISLDFNNTQLPVKSSYSNFYNPTIANTTLYNLTISNNLRIVVKNPKSYNDKKMAIAVCSNVNNFDNKFCSDTNLTIFSDNLLINKLKTWRQIFIENIDLSNNYLILVLEYDSNNKFDTIEKLVIRKSDNKIINKIDSDYIYYKNNGTIDSDTTNMLISDITFVDTIDSTDFEITTTEINNAINILKSDSSVKGFLSFEYNDNVNSIGNNLSENDTYFNFISCYNVDRYKNDTYNNILNDFVSSSSTYFNTRYNNTVIIPNMYQKYDNFNNKYRYITVNGLYAGLLFKSGLTKIIDHDYNFGKLKLLYYPNIEQRQNLNSYYINSFFRKNNIVYIYGNRNIHNNKETLKYLNQNGIAKRISYELVNIKNKYTNLNVKNMERSLRLIVSDIESVLRVYENDLKANSIQLYNTNTPNNVSIEVLIYFKDFIEEISLNINISI